MNPRKRPPPDDSQASQDDITAKLILALEEIEASTVEHEIAKRQWRALRRLEVSTFDELLCHQHRLRINLCARRLLGTISGHAPDGLIVQADDGTRHLVATSVIDAVEFISARSEPAVEFVSFATELERMAKQGACRLVDTTGVAHQLDLVIALAEDYLYYRGHGGVPTALRLACIALVSPGLPNS
ncbi:MAG: hypothetical protein ACYCWN_05510 [Ferrimicrobium sp.]|jgi:hypothetical protein|uniref:DUF222 domain-containing protein n=1 Tax=Ferrimicrobium acidiphilum TaxID=121039 RepID=A0ABV3Y6V1_9ACTN|nr:hypothetical protein [Ferrimicrobium sp.]MCL5973290.1 hypothetical protein [Actinomycetota bacterium]